MASKKTPSTAVKSFSKHHFNEWSEDKSGLGGLMRAVLTQPGDAHTTCKRCGVRAVNLRVGGTKFWVSKNGVGKWVSKRPPCEVAPASTGEDNPFDRWDDASSSQYGLGYMQGRGAS